MSYRARIKRLPEGGEPIGQSPLYVVGYRQARTDAARVAAEADETIAELRREHDEDQGVIRVWRGRAERADETIAKLVAALKVAREELHYHRDSGDDISGSAMATIDAALAEATKGT